MHTQEKDMSQGLKYSDNTFGTSDNLSGLKTNSKGVDTKFLQDGENTNTESSKVSVNDDFAELAREVDIDRLETYLLSKNAALVHAQKYKWYDPRFAWCLLTHPSPGLSALHIRRRARMLAAVCLIFFVISVISNAMAYANHERFPGVRATHTVLNVAILVAYAFSRLAKFQIGADILTFGTWLLCYVHACADLAADHEDYHTLSSFYTWLYTPAWMFFAVLFGTPMRVVILVVLDVISLLNLPAFTSNTYGAMPRMLLMHASCDMAIVLSVLIHSRDLMQLNQTPSGRHVTGSENDGNETRGSQMWISRLFYAPADAVVDRAERRRSRVLSVMLLYMMLSGGAWAYLHSKLGDIPDNFGTAIGAWIGACFALYILSRTAWTHAASVLTVIGVYIVPFAIIWSNHSSLEATLPLYLTHSTLAALLATMLLRGVEMMVIGLCFLIPTFFANVAPFPPTSIITLLLCACSIITLLDLRDLRRLEAARNALSAASNRPIWYGDHSSATSKLLHSGRLTYIVFGVVGCLLLMLNFISMGSDVSATRNAALPVSSSSLATTSLSDDQALQTQGVSYVLRVETAQSVDASQQYIINADQSITEFVNEKPLSAGTTNFYFTRGQISGKIQSISVWLLGGGAQYSQTAQIQSMTLEDISNTVAYVWPSSDGSKLPMQGDDSQVPSSLSFATLDAGSSSSSSSSDSPSSLRKTPDTNAVSAGYLQWSSLSGDLMPAGAIFPDETMALWDDYTTKFNVYNWTRDDFARFVDQVKQIFQQNERLTPSKAALNAYSIVPTDTFLAQRTGLKNAPVNNAESSDFSTLSDDTKFTVQDIPSSWDWRNVNGASAITPIKNQGSCGSCWTFAGAAAMESANILSNAISTDMSTQEYVDCTNSANGYSSAGCEGGWYGDVFDFAASKGTCTWTTYAYTGVDGTCKSLPSSCTMLTTKPLTNGWKYVSQTETAIQTALMTRPLAIALAVDSGNGWNNYRSGVLSTCGTSNNHAVLLIGWGTDTASGHNYWIIKNSWGTSWGESGFVRLLRNGSCFCGMCSNAAIVTYSTSCPAMSGPQYSTGSCAVTSSGGTCSSITCTNGVLSGTMSVTCTSGQWSAIGTCNPPASSNPCPALAAPQYGTGSCPSTPAGSTCSGITCTYGVATGTIPLTCTSGVWGALTCKGPSCAALSAPANGAGSCPVTADGGTCSSITCTYGIASGSTLLKCTAGTWSTLTCNSGAQACAAISAPTYGTGSCPQTASGSTCTVSCTYGVASGSTTLTCTNAVWSTVTCKSPPACPAMAAPQYGNGSCPSTASGSTCSGIQCLYGVASGSSVLTCTNGAWSSLTCAAANSCPAISAPTYGTGTCPATSNGQTCTTQVCTNGVATGSAVRTCTNGVWSALTCVAPTTCPALGAPMYGTGDCPVSTQNAACTQTCQYGVATGSTMRVCNNGVWSDLTCQVPCSALSAPQYGSGSCPTSSSGVQCQQSCLYGAAIVGSTLRVCTSSVWSALTCPAPASCAALSAPTYGSGTCPQTADSQTCLQTCTNGVATGGGSTTRTCSNGVWSPLTCAAGAITNVDCAVQWSAWSSCSTPCGYDWISVARTDGTRTISSTFYSAGTGLPTDANYAVPCSQFSYASYPNAIIRVTMGSMVDYFQARPTRSLCDLLTIQGLFLYSPNVDGPFVAPMYYPFYIGGSATNWPIAMYGAQDQRAYLSFWGGGTGGCCYNSGTKGAPLGRASFGRAFSIDLLTRPGTQSRTATVTTQPSGTGAACPSPLTQTQSCSCAVSGGWTAFSSTCSATCNGGFIFRSCTNPAPAYGGAPCMGSDWAYCAAQPCSSSAGVVGVTLTAARNNMTSGDVFQLQTNLRSEVAEILKVSSDWISVLNVVPNDDSVSVTFGLDSSSPVIGSDDNQAMTSNLSDAVSDPTSTTHLSILYPLMSTSTLDASSGGYSTLFIAEVTLGSLLGLFALIFLSGLCKRMYRHYRDDKESKWSGEPVKPARPQVQSTQPTKFDLNQMGSFSVSMSRGDSVDTTTVHPAAAHAKTASFDHGGLNVGSYGYTNPVANRTKPISITVAPVTSSNEMMRVPSNLDAPDANRPPNGPPVPPR